MSKNIKDSLHELIHSLSKSEKRYFKLLSSRHTIGDVNNYIVLFDFLDKQEVYDEELLFKKFKGEAFLNNFSITKKRLYDHVLGALDTFYTSKSIDAQLYKLLHSADILYSKSLYKHAERVLKSAQKLASKHQRFTLLIEISNRQKRLFENNAYAQMQASDLDAINAMDLESISNIQNHLKLWNLKSELFMELSRKGISRDSRQKQHFETIYNAVQQIPNPHELASESRYLYHHIKSAYFFAIQNFERSLENLEMIIDLIEEDTIFLAEHPNSYFSTLTNAIYISERLFDDKRAKLLLHKLKTFPELLKVELSEDLQIKLFSSVHSIELSMMVTHGNFEDAAKLIPLIESGLRLYQDKISRNRVAFFAFKFAAIKFGTGSYSEAMKWVNAILNDSDLDRNEDIVAFTHILDLLIHLELKHDKLLPYSIKRTHRFLKSRNRLYEFEKVLLRFITKLTNSNQPLDSEELWRELFEELADLKSDINQLPALEYFDFETWAQAKFHRKNFEELVREKYLLRCAV